MPHSLINVRPIRTEADHDAALGEVERLCGSKAGTPDEDCLDVLIVLIYDRTAIRPAEVEAGQLECLTIRRHKITRLAYVSVDRVQWGPLDFGS